MYLNTAISYFFYRLILLPSLLTMIMTVPVFAQHPNFKNYTDDVLPTGNIYTSFQDSKGFMWFGSDRGAIRFDGNTFTNYTTAEGVADNEIFGFFEDHTGRIWFESMNGKVSYHKDGEFFNSSRDTTLKALDSESLITKMFEDNEGNLWIATGRNGIVCYHHDGIVRRFLGGSELTKVYNIFSSGDKSLIIMTFLGVFDFHFNDNFSAFEKIDTLSLRSISPNYPKFLRLSDDVFIFEDEFNVFSMDISVDSREIVLKLPEPQSSLNLSSIENIVWICATHGTIPYDIKSHKFGQPLLKNHPVTSVFKDREGNYWFTTLGDGIFFSTVLNAYCYTIADGLITNHVTCLAKDPNDRVWLGYSTGCNANISWVDQKKIHSLKLIDNAGYGKLSTRKINFRNGDCFVATSMAVFSINSDHNIKALYGFSRDVLRYDDSKVWICGGASAFLISKESLNTQMLDVRNFPLAAGSNYVVKDIIKRTKEVRSKTLFMDRNNNLWIGTEHKLYVSKDGYNLKLVDPLQIGDKMVNDIDALKDNTLVLGTNGKGLVFLRNEVNVLTLGVNNGLSNNFCNAVHVDNTGTIWIATNNGLNKISGYPDNINIDVFNSHDGLLSNEIADVLVVKDTVWTATKKGLNFFHKDQLRKVDMTPLIYVDRITANGKPQQINSHGNYIFPYPENDISINYTGLLYGNGEPLLYRYKLHQTDEWRYTRSMSVYLPELSSDDYTFTVSARGRTGIWSNDVSIDFKIERPFWQTTTFVLLVLAAVITILWMVIAGYISQQKSKIEQQHRVTLSELKTLRAQMNPHFLFNALNSIQGVLLKNNLENTQDYLGKFGKLMRMILDHSDKTTIAIAEEMESVTNYLELEQLRTSHQFEYRIDIDPALDIYNTEIPAMILQPFIENAIWHGFGHKGENDLLLIRFGFTDAKDISIIIEDNGIGRRKAQLLRTKSHKSKGIHLVTERIDILNFNNRQKIVLSIEDLEDESGNHPGTRVSIQIPAL